MSDIISILLPTRQRPYELARLVDSINATATNPELLEMVTWIDEDDDTYRDLELPVDWAIIRGSRLHEDGLVNLSAKWCACYGASHGDIVMHAGDDIVFRTPGWDHTVREAFDEVPDKILFAYGRDGIQPDTFGTHGFVSRAWVDAVGYWFPPLFSSDFNDVFLNDVAKAIGRHRFIPIYTEHLHFCIGKADIDQNTQERLERHQQDRPDLLYFGAEVQAMIQEAAERLREAMNEA